MAGNGLAAIRPTYKDWLPGVAGIDPRLGYRFRGVNYEEGGLHRPPFSFLGKVKSNPAYQASALARSSS